MGLNLNQVLTWYQGKIGAYDKEDWEETVEHRILHGLSNIPKKSAKLKNELIDIDFIRGSSFPKPKSKHGVGTVFRLACLRLLFLPFYRSWWSRHTYPKTYWLLVILYAIQMGCMGVYILIAGSQIEGSARPYFDDVSSVEIFVPGLMMFVLTFILCQIVAGHSPTPRSWKRHRAKRSRRQKKRTHLESRRSFASVGGSKSSLDTSNNEGYEGSLPANEGHQSPAREKIRSFSEERVRSPPVALRNQRSASVNLEPGVFDRARRAFHNHNFLRWLRFARNTPRTNEDEGFDSLNGNCSSSCDDVLSRDGDPVLVPGRVAEADGAKVDKKRDAEKLLRWKNESDWECDSRKNGLVENLASRRQEATMRPSSFRSPEAKEEVSAVDGDTDMHQSETEGSSVFHRPRRASITLRNQERPAKRRTPPVLTLPTTRLNGESSYNSSCESDGDTQTPAASPSYKAGGGTAPLDWTGVTTNSEECSYSSESETDVDNHAGFVDAYQDDLCFDPYGLSTILHPSCPPSDKVSCTIWEDGDAKKADLSVLDISAAIIAKVDALPESTDYLNGGILTAVVVAILPLLYRLNGECSTEVVETFRSLTSLNLDVISQIPGVCNNVLDVILGASLLEKFVVLSAAAQRFVTASCFLFLLAVAERTFKQRFLYAKLFSHLTSSRRARRSDVPHFRLNKVRNIKTWLSVRSYIKKRGPQHSIDCIVSAAFIITLFLVSFLCMALVKESQSIHQSLYNLEVLCWCLVLGVFLLRFMTLGSKINRKYRSLSVLITEQINLYLQMEQKPTKKEELLLANNVLKLAADLLKELESPFKISGMSANPILYNLTKIVVLSAVSGVLSEILGFKLKLHKLKLS